MFRVIARGLSSLLLLAATSALVQPASAASAAVVLPEKCVVATQQDAFVHCEIDKVGRYSVAVIGDSHARSWFAPMLKLASKYSWKLTIISKSACPVLNPASMPQHIPSPTCKHWNENLQSYLKANHKYDLVLSAASSLVTHGYDSYAQSFKSVVPSLTKSGAQLLLVHDNPKPASGFLDCIKNNPNSASTACARDRAAALTPNDPMPDAARGMAGVKVVDFTNSFCGPKTCSPVIDGIVVYKDHSHMSPEWAMHMLPVLDAAIPKKFKG
jgi:hypothetical protein